MKLAKDEDVGVRRALAHRPLCSKVVLILAHDQDDQVRINLVRSRERS
jgi:hypothetical protein